MKLHFLFIGLIIFSISANSQQKITFYSSDKVLITADDYKTSTNGPYVLFFHQAGSSRGEYDEIAPKIKKLGYNCLAVDLRYGSKERFISNETADDARNKGLSPQAYDARKDIEAAIALAYNRSRKPVVLFGSSFSASLCLMVAKNNPRIKAVIGFSPGEFFGSAISVKDSLIGFDKPVFLASTAKEFPYIQELAMGIPDISKTLFRPSGGNGVHGAKALWKESSSTNEYWLALLSFFRELEENPH